MNYILIFLATILLVPGCLSDEAGESSVSTVEPPPTMDQESLTRSDTQGAVSIEVTFLNPLQPAGEDLTFRIALNTHSVDLSEYRIEEMATLRNSEGLSVKKGGRWVPEQESFHHRRGALFIPPITEDGRPLIGGDTEFLLLEIDGIDGKKRTFQWGKEALDPLR
jgi:hypothetical protein